MELAIAILREKPREESEAIRSWAIEILKRYSPVEVPQRALNELKLVPIRDALDGNVKTSSELTQEVTDLMRKWKALGHDISSLSKRSNEPKQ